MNAMTETATAPPARPLRTAYVLHERLGAGGQGEVWRAHDPNRGADIALKILRPGPGRSSAAWGALLHEYDSASRLDHPYILKVYPPEREENTFLLPMELATGGDLRRLRGADYLAIVPVLIEVAQALEHAHEHGVIHRDLKPGNVLFDARGRVKLADFGVSGRAPDPGTDALIRGLSPFTASPEQLRGEPPTPFDDIYSLGALAYELLTRFPPYYPHFDARRVQEEPVPPLVPSEQIPPQLGQLVTRMLAKDPRERPASMREVIDELEVALNDTLTFELDGAQSAHEAPPLNATVLIPEEIFATQPPHLTVPRPKPLIPVTEMAVSSLRPRRGTPPTLGARPTLVAASSDTPPPASPPRATVLTMPTPSAAAPTLSPGVPDAPTYWDETRGMYVYPREFRPMPSNAPRVLLVLIVLGFAAVGTYMLLQRYYGPNSQVSLSTLAASAVASINPSAPPPEHAPPGTLPPAATAAAPARADAHPGDGYARAAGEGFAALGAGRLDEARTAFERARGMRPSGAEALEGLRRVNAAIAERNAEAPRARTVADRGQDATRLAQLSDSLQDLIDHPNRLQSPDGRDQAAALLQTAQEEPNPDGDLELQMARLTSMLPELAKPVTLSMISDSFTQVSIPNVGIFGSFAEHDIQLKPGHYTIVGSREGYRDVRREFTVSPGQQGLTLTISCDQTI
jgi:serine/threonine protein kinase